MSSPPPSLPTSSRGSVALRDIPLRWRDASRSIVWGAAATVAAVCLTLTVDGAFAADGARLANGCSSCHGIEGRGGRAIPSLAGLDETRLRERMHEFAKGNARSTVMSRLMAGYSDEEIAALAAYFSRVSP